MNKIFFAALAVLMLGAFAFADVGPGPAPTAVTVNLRIGSQPYAGNVSMIYLCSYVTSRENGPVLEGSSVEPYDKVMQCHLDVCTRSDYYKFNPCASSKGRFQLTANGKIVTSSEVSLEKPGNHTFYMDVNSGAVSTSSDAPATCWPSALVFALVGGIAYAKGSRKKL